VRSFFEPILNHQPKDLDLVMRFTTILLAIVSLSFLLTACDSDLADGNGRIYAGGVLFGQQIALDGDVALIQASGSDDAYFMHRQNDSWQVATHMRPRHPRTQLAWSISLRGDVAVIGTREASPESGPPNYWPGLAYVYHRSGNAWREVAALQPDDLTFRAQFGWQVVTDGHHLAISAQRDGIDPLSVEESSVFGSVHIYQRSGDTWTRTARLVNPSPTPMTGIIGDPFGRALALDDNRLVVYSGSLAETGLQDAGLLRVYTFDGGEWNETTRITHPDAREGDQFGIRLALDGPLLAALAGGRSAPNGGGGGTLYLFRQIGDNWVYEADFMPEDLGLLDGFGWSLDAYGDRVAVGAPGRRNSVGNQGSVFIYVRDASGSWSLEQELEPRRSDGRELGFGEAVALDGDRLLVGAIYTDRGEEGSVFEYRREGSTWVRVEG
jgi:hypothetical protein